jgi:hypothetical protein
LSITQSKVTRNPPNCRETVFQHQDLTKTTGNPTFNGLAQLEQQCKANAQSVLSTIGNGNLGHLGLVSSTLACERSSPGVPFVRPILPILPDLANFTAAQIAEAHRLFAEQTNTFNACNQIERAIIQQINTALDDDCLADLISQDTGLIQGTVPEIFTDLHRTFGAIAPQILAVAKATLAATICNHTKPLANIFTAIARCADMAHAAECEETAPQLINIGLTIFARPTAFANDIRNWHELTPAAKTWNRFKTHFKDAQQTIIRSLPPPSPPTSTTLPPLQPSSTKSSTDSKPNKMLTPPSRPTQPPKCWLNSKQEPATGQHGQCYPTKPDHV